MIDGKLKPKKYLFCFGTRPEAIKMAPVIKEAEQRGHVAAVCLTGQHQEMIVPFLELFSIKPSYHLKVMKKGQSLTQLTVAILSQMEDVFKKDHFDCVFVQGDTTSTFACALSAYYHSIPVAHIEAGLRTGDIYSPFPEEANRRLVSPIAQFHFPPTEVSENNLNNEGIVKNVIKTGNTSIDCLRVTLKEIDKLGMDASLCEKYPFVSPLRKMILVTAHRRENHGMPLEHICKALKEVSSNGEVDIVFPVHLNPNVRSCVNKYLADVPSVHLLEPLDYVDFSWLMKKSFLILTDSGGVQEEAPYFKKPILVLRENTERPEGVSAGVSKLVGANEDMIISEIRKLLSDNEYYESFSKSASPYGDGSASPRILEYIEKNL